MTILHRDKMHGDIQSEDLSLSRLFRSLLESVFIQRHEFEYLQEKQSSPDISIDTGITISMNADK
jgi:hypothetical protein